MAKPKRSVDPEVAFKHALRGQLRAFRKKFGRDPLEGEPVFFDPDKDVPMQMTEERVREDVLAVLSNFPPQFAYAYAKTGLALLTEEHAEHYDPKDVAEWKEAIDENFSWRENAANIDQGRSAFDPKQTLGPLRVEDRF